MSERQLIGELPFEVDARVAIQLGRESISSSLTAIIELVKNAYDADAENVTISLNNIEYPAATMIIEDNGNGMNIDDLKNSWLRIGTDNKQMSVKSRNKFRVMTGAKGLGRLGIDRLCKSLILQTKTEDIEHVNELEITWTDYEVSGQGLSEIKHGLYTNAVPEDSIFLNMSSKGTRLVLSELKDNWTSEAVKELRSELALLVSPFGEVNDFSIEIKSEYDELNGIVSSVQYLEAAEWSVHSEIDEKNWVSASMTSKIHEKEFNLEPSEWKEWIKTQKEVPRCGPLSFDFYYIPRRTAAEFKKIDFERKHIIDFLENNCGIRIYRDYFRAKPYGNPDGSGDWLGLGYRRSQNPAASSRKGWPVAPQQIVGAVFISRDKNPGLIDQTNREGIVEESPFFDLRTFTLKIIEWFEANVVSFNQANKPVENGSEKAREATWKAKSKIDDIKKSISKFQTAKTDEERSNVIGAITAEINEVEKNLDESEKHVEESARQFEEEKNTLANLASLGILTVCFGHEAKGNCNRAYLLSQDLQESFEKGKFMIMPDLEDEFRKQIRIIMESTDYVHKFAGFALENVKRNKRTQTNISMPKIARKVIDTFAPQLEKQGINIYVDDIRDDTPVLKGFEIDWESIFVNLLTNSIWAFRNFPTPEGGKVIQLSIKEESGSIIIVFADNAKGLETGTEKMIFNPGFSTRRNDKGIVEGTGMGLAIVHTLVCDHAGGTIKATSPGQIGGVEFIIKVPVIT